MNVLTEILKKAQYHADRFKRDKSKDSFVKFQYHCNKGYKEMGEKDYKEKTNRQLYLQAERTYNKFGKNNSIR